MERYTRTLFVAGAFACTGCFPDYEVEKTTEMPAPTVAMHSGGHSLTITPNGSDSVIDGLEYPVGFSHDFSIDEVEVTVGRFREWWDAGHPHPSDGTALDPSGQYPDMVWHAAWAASAETNRFENDCPPGPSHYGQTWTLDPNGTADYPMTCVTWPQAVAFCAWDGHKRLPTFAEWTWVRTDQGTTMGGFPWGANLPTCSDAWIGSDASDPNTCGFPKGVGTSGKDRTDLGVEDVVGSVYEWVWDVAWADGGTPSGGEQDFAGDTDNSDPSTQHFRAGGAFISSPTSPQVLAGFTHAYGADEPYNDAGFRCVRTVE
jgi:formylglycine-generating enzyme required for sulfatase activity